MNASPMFSRGGVHFELQFRPLLSNGPGYAFPCDAEGHVNMDELSERARENYLYARTVVGREVSVPAVQPSDESATSTSTAVTTATRA